MAKEPEESQEVDPTQVYLAYLRGKREQIDQLIKIVEGVGTEGLALLNMPIGQIKQPSAIESEGAFLGMTVAEATVKLLGLRKKALNNAEIYETITAGGVAMNSALPLNTLGSILRRRAADTGDIVRVGKTWGLSEWYPNASRFSRRSKKG